MTAAPAERSYDVAHSTQIWLSKTMTWLDTQVRFMPPRVSNHVICDVTENLDQFPLDNLTSADRDAPLWRFLSRQSWQIARRRRSWLLRDRATACGAAIVHSHFGDRGWFNLADVARIGALHVVTFYGYDVGRLPKIEPAWRARYRELFAAADLFLCEGPHLADELIALGCPENKVRVHHLGIDIERIAFRPRSWTPGTPLRVLLAGSFVEKKGMVFALEALGRIAGDVDLAVTIVGDDNGQPRSRDEKARILAAIEAAGLNERTRRLGYQPYDALLEAAYASHVFLSPSVTASDGDTEGGAPVSLIDMAATGMPVVSSTHCDIPEVLEDGVSGWLAGEADVDGLERRLRRLIDDPDDWVRLAGNARRHIEREFDARIQGRRLAAHYDALLDTLA